MYVCLYVWKCSVCTLKVEGGSLYSLRQGLSNERGLVFPLS